MRDYQTYSIPRTRTKELESTGIVVELRLRARQLRRSARWFLVAVVAAIVAGGLTYVWLPRWVAAESVVIDRIVDNSIELGELRGKQDRLIEAFKRDREFVVRDLILHGHALESHGGASVLTGREQSTDLDAGYFSPEGMHGWVVGESGVILNTRDGGERWTFQKGYVSEDLHEIHFANDLKRGWIVGEDGVLLGTKDGGVTWYSIDSTASVKLWDVHFTDDSTRGWIVGENGLVLRTTDMGETWTSKYSGSRSTTLFDVHFSANGQVGWAVGSEGTILKSIDGGETWTSRQSGVDQFLIDVYFDVDGKFGWVVGRDGVILHTEDGGEQWNEQNGGTDVDLMDVEFLPGSMSGVIVGSGGVILSTENRGEEWKHENSGHSHSVFDLDFVAGDNGAENVVWMVGRNGRIFRTTIRERNWNTHVWQQPRDLNGLDVSTNGDVVWVVGEVGLVLHTVDHGETWVRAELDDIASGENWNDVDFLGGLPVEERKGWMVGNNGMIMHTVNGGANWDYQRSPVGYNLYAGVFFEDQQGGSIHGWTLLSQQSYRTPLQYAVFIEERGIFHKAST